MTSLDNHVESLEKESPYERLRSFFGQIQDFDSVVYPQMKQIETIAQAGQIDEEMLSSVSHLFFSHKIFEHENFFWIAHASPIKEYCLHDLATLETILLLAKGKVEQTVDTKEMDTQETLRFLSSAIRVWKKIFFVLEDAILKVEFPEIIPKEKIEPVSLDDMEYVISEFVESQAVQEYIRESTQIFIEKLSPDKFILANTAVVSNLLCNIIRNAARNVSTITETKDDTSLIFFDAFPEENFYIIRVSDSGTGIPATIFPKQDNSDRGIFEMGRSNEGSSGIGLANADKRISSMDIDFSILSHDPETHTEEFWTTAENQEKSSSILSDLKAEHTQTIFEFKFLIHRKNTAEI